MENFNYFNGTRYIFGKNTENDVGKYLLEFGAHNVLIHYGSEHAKKSGLIDKVIESLKKSGIKFCELGGVQPNPRDSKVYEGIKIAKDNKVDFILAVGGGSVIDSAKAIAMGYYYDGDFSQIFLNQKNDKNCLPIGVILTISAAGSESSTNSVITFEKQGLKRGFKYELSRPKFAILNPELTYSLPEYHLHAGIMDIMAHMFERYFSPSKDVFVSKGMLEGILHAIIHEIVPRINKNRTDYEANANLMWAGSLAHNNILGCDRIQDWGSHKMGHELSAKYDTIHGASLAVMFPAWMKFNYKNNIELFDDFATKIIGVKEEVSKEKTILKAIAKFEQFLSNDLKLPTSFKEINAKEEDIPYLVEKLFEGVNVPIGLFNPLTKESATKIYKLACK